MKNLRSSLDIYMGQGQREGSSLVVRNNKTEYKEMICLTVLKPSHQEILPILADQHLGFSLGTSTQDRIQRLLPVQGGILELRHTHKDESIKIPHQQVNQENKRKLKEREYEFLPSSLGSQWIRKKKEGFLKIWSPTFTTQRLCSHIL